jgi:hypothetical protein
MIWAELFAALRRRAAPTPPTPPMPPPSKDNPLPCTGHGEAVLASPLSGFHGEARKLNAGDLYAAARKLGVDPLDLKVIIAVETSGAGFDAENRPFCSSRTSFTGCWTSRSAPRPSTRASPMRSGPRRATAPTPTSIPA